jgi:hypothetical protein
LHGATNKSPALWLFVVLQVTQLERAMNVLVFVQFSALVIFSAVLAGLEQDWSLKHMPTEWWYLQYVNNFPANLEPSPGALGWFVQVGDCVCGCCMQ